MGLRGEDRAGVDQINQAVDVDAIPIGGDAIADDRAVIVNGDQLIAVEAVDVDAGSILAFDRAAGLVGDGHRIRAGGARIGVAAGDAVPRAFDEAAVVDGHAGVALRVNAIIAGGEA